MIKVLERPAPRPVEPVAAHVVTAAACSVALGLLVAVVGLRFGAIAVVALTVLALVVPLAWRRPDLAVLGVIVTLPVGTTALGPFEVVQASVAGAALVVLVKAASRVSVELPTWHTGVPLASFALIAALATTRTRDAELAFNLDLQLGLLLLLVVAMVTAFTRYDDVRRGVLLLVLAGGVIAAVAVVGSGPTTTYYAGGVVEGRAQGIFGQPNELGVTAASLGVLAVGAALASRTRPTRWACLGCAAVLVAALGLSLSRGAWIGFLVGLGVLCLLSPPARRPLAKAGGAVLALLAVLLLAGTGFSTILVERVSSLGEATDNPYDQRTEIWAEAVRQIGENPLIGSGPGGFTTEAKEQSLRVGISLDVEHAHNLFLNVGVEFGAVGLVALLGLMAGLLLSAVRARAALVTDGHGPEAELPAALAAALVAVVVHGMLDYPLRNAVCITTVFLLIGLLVTARRRSLRRTVVGAASTHLSTHLPTGRLRVPAHPPAKPE